jgi:DNA polymerase
MFIGEKARALDEDAQGDPFVGRLAAFTQILTAGGIDRKDVYITNIVKCRPPEKQGAHPRGDHSLRSSLQTQIMLIDPALINTARKHTREMDTQDERGHNQDQGHVVQLAGHRGNADVPPKLLLRNASTKEGSPKHLTWIDIREVKRAWDMVRETGNISHIKFG